MRMRVRTTKGDRVSEEMYDRVLINTLLICLSTPSCREFLRFMLKVIKLFLEKVLVEITKYLESMKMEDNEGWWGE